MNATQPIKQNSLQIIIQSWKDQIICFPPQGQGYSAYLVNDRDCGTLNYIQANCDELRHLATNYNSLSKKIKEEYYGYLKEAVLNTVKYEATRRAVRKQHEWIQESYQNLIKQKQISVEQQQVEISRLKQIINEQTEEVIDLKDRSGNRLTITPDDLLLQQKEAELEQKNREIERLNRQLQECDREINSLKFELNKGLQELKLKYTGMITQFILSRTQKHQIDRQNKSLEACKNIFIKAQQKINSLQSNNNLMEPESDRLQREVKLLRVRAS